MRLATVNLMALFSVCTDKYLLSGMLLPMGIEQKHVGICLIVKKK